MTLQKYITKSERYLFFLFILLLPIQLGKHFWPDFSLVQGVRVDYLSPTLYLTDLIALLFLPSVISRINNKKLLYSGFFLLISYLLLNTLLSLSFLNTVVKSLKVLEVFVVVLFIKNIKIDYKKHFLSPLVISTSFISVIAIIQFLLGRNIGGPMYFFGERSFNVATPGIALVDILSVSYLRAYSIFSHPNSLAGYLGIVLIFLIFTKNKTKALKVSGVIILISFILTFSKSSMVAFIIAITASKYMRLGKYSKYLFSAMLFCTLLILAFGLIIPKSGLLSIDQRVLLNNSSIHLFLLNPLFGIGLGNFTNQIGVYVRNMSVWFAQPVHNIYLLLFVEAGVVGIFLLSKYVLTSFDRINKNALLNTCFLFVMLTGLTDHYWLTLQQNILLLAVLIGLSYKLIDTIPHE